MLRIDFVNKKHPGISRGALILGSMRMIRIKTLPCTEFAFRIGDLSGRGTNFCAFEARCGLCAHLGKHLELPLWILAKFH